MLNPHHLELFYYVARHGGISRAVRHMPYGIQQPALSGQLLQLEQSLGLRLFERTPFRLTPAGVEMYAVVRPFFENLPTLEASLRADRAPLLRLGAAELVLRDHLPPVLEHLRRLHPGLRLHLRSGYQEQLQGWLLEREIDLAVTALDSRPPPGLHRQTLVHLPLVLLVPRKSPLRSAAALWRQPRPDLPLICLPPGETISRHFERGLRRRGLTWPPAIVASSMETVTRYVAAGHGVGVGVDAGPASRPRNVRLLPLAGFAPVEIVALWAGRPPPVVNDALNCIQAYAREKWPAASPPPVAAGARLHPDLLSP